MGKTTGGPAFPVMHKNVTGSFDGICGSLQEVQMDGMTLRDYFAGKAIAGLTANMEMLQAFKIIAKSEGCNTQDAAAKAAYDFADAMLAARNK